MSELSTRFYDAVSSVLHDPMLVIADAAEFRGRIWYRDETTQLVMLERGAAQLIDVLPDHNMNARQLREAARRTQSVHSVSDWITDLVADYGVKISRVARLRTV